MNQNTHNHTTPDWKFHVSCEFAHIPFAWNTLVALFIESRADIGLKVCDPIMEEEWPESQKGREITIYVYSHCRDSETNFVKEESKGNPDYRLGEELELLYNEVFWFTWIDRAESLLSDLNVRSRGLAIGDLHLPNCDYFSLRNEAFVKQSNGFVYPSNDLGFNASQQPIPLFLLKLLYFLISRIQVFSNP